MLTILKLNKTKQNKNSLIQMKKRKDSILMSSAPTQQYELLYLYLMCEGSVNSPFKESMEKFHSFLR